MHVRVLPNTKHFPRELKQQLQRIEKSMPPLTVEISKAKVHTQKIKRSIQAQLASVRDLEVNVDTKVDAVNASRSIEKLTRDKRIELLPELDNAMLGRVAKQVDKAIAGIEAKITPFIDDDGVRAKVYELTSELKKLEKDLHISVLSEEQRAVIRHRIHQIGEELDDMAKDRTVHLGINPFTAWASSRLAWLTRPRVVEIVPRVSKAALTKAMTALSALSGARLSYDYLKRFSDWMSEIDKKLPTLTFGVTGVTTAFSGLMGALSGIVGIGDGLAATLPSLLLLPGLLAGAVLSGVALVVALKDAKDELAELGDSYRNLGDIISSNFWAEARQPIIEFSNSIMPQLERSFEKTSAAIGRFTANLAKSFQQEFDNGRLEAMFDGLTASWDVLATGTDAFAGAITNLGLVASRYMPRLASWFVRLANTFDTWLSDVATDGRLDEWIEGSIDAFYALWDVAAATTGILQGLWKAAEAGGSGGLRGFADTLLDWEKAINGAKWQDTLVAMFRGAGVAMDGFGEGLKRVGDMLYSQRDAIEYFMGTAGQALGDFLGDVAEALSRPAVADGLTGFIDGVKSGLDSLEPALGPMADAFSDLAIFAGDLADAVGPVLQTALETASGIMSDLLASFKDHDVVKRLADAFNDFLESDAGPVLEDLASSIGEELVPALVELSGSGLPALGTLVELLGPLASGMVGEASEGIDALADSLTKLTDIFSLYGDKPNDEMFSTDWITESTDSIQELLGLINPVWGALNDFGFSLNDLTNSLSEYFSDALAAMDDLFVGLSVGIATAILWVTSLPEQITSIFIDTGIWLVNQGAEIIGGLQLGATSAWVSTVLWLSSIPNQVIAFFTNAGTWLVSRGSEILNGLQAGATSAWVAVVVWFAGLPGTIASFFSGAGNWLFNSGVALLEGFGAGVQSAIGSVAAKVATAVAHLRGLFPNSPAKWGPFSGRGWVSYSGQAIGQTFGDSIASSLNSSKAKVVRSITGIRGEFSSLSGDVSGMNFDVAGQFALDRAHAARLGSTVTPLSSGTTSVATNVTANFIQPEQREQFREFSSLLQRELRK
ncbi:hypothetical protein ACFWHR_07650 [Leucobacter sp. NPDC058333]|uniref:hypothetical protein n=1 Tax=Leucobacter sp. NPDC058333 TaxID=3346450 RepID=UPI00364D2D12